MASVFRALYTGICYLIDFSVRLLWRCGLFLILCLYVCLAVGMLRRALSERPAVLDLIYWRDVKKSGVVFGVTLALLICLAVFNIITVVSYAALIVLAAALGYRAYNSVMATVQKSEHKNPFQPYLEHTLDLPQDRVHEQVDVVLKHAKDLVHHLRRLFFVEDLFDTLKFALFLWALTYVGAYFSGIALVILAFVGLFTLPKVYELYQPQIDHYYGIVEAKVKQASDIAREQLDKVPFFKKPKQAEKTE